MGKAMMEQRDEKRDALKLEKEKNRELRQYIEKLETDLKKLASINATLISENQILKAAAENDKIVLLHRKQ